MKKQTGKNGKMTLEKLARMVQKGFEETATKKEFQALREEIDQRFQDMDRRFDEIDIHFQGVDNKINALHFEIKEIKSILPPLFKAMSQFDVEVVSLRQRVSRIEKKVGLAK